MIKIENLGSLEAEPTGGFSHLDIFVASQRFMTTVLGVKDIDGANAAVTVEELAEITGDHVFEDGYGFTKFTAIKGKNGLESAIIGDGKMYENKLTVFIEGSDAKTLGAIRQFKAQKDLIVLAREAGSGRLRQLGHARYPCDMMEGTSVVAPEYEGLNGTTIVFSDKNKVAAPIYKGEVTAQSAAV
jgi:hypothetical protein